MAVTDVKAFLGACHSASRKYTLVSQETNYKPVKVFDCRAPDGVRITLIKIPDLIEQAEAEGKDPKVLFADMLLEAFNSMLRQFDEKTDESGITTFVRLSAEEVASQEQDLDITQEDLVNLAKEFGVLEE